MTELLEVLRSKLERGRKLFVPYLMTGAPDADVFARCHAAVAPHADAVELGAPFSDPLMDGPVIAAAGDRAIRGGTGPIEALGLIHELPSDPPKIVMTYYNPIHKLGEAEFCRRAAEAGIRGLIVPDLPLEESGRIRSEAAATALAWIPLVAPTSSPARVAAITAAATGFVYAVSTLGVTGTRAELAVGAARVVEACRAATDLPVLVGIGVSNAEQARAAAAYADGVVVGSALVRLATEEGPEAAGRLAGEIRAAL